MTFPTYQETTTTAGGATGSTTFSANFPATVNAGDLLLVIVGNDGSRTLQNIAGWTYLVDDDASFVTGKSNILYKSAVGDEDGGTLDFTTDASNTWFCSQIIRVATGTWNSVEINTIATTTASAAPDPSTATPSWGAQDTLFIAIATSFDDAAIATVYPTSYINGNTVRSHTVANESPAVHTATRELNATSDDPSAFTIDTADDVSAWVVMVEPVAAGTNTSILVPTGPLR